VVVWTTFCLASGRTLPKAVDGTEQCRDRWQTTFDRESKGNGRDEEELIKDMHRRFGPK
jgi:hypothetical protein